MVRPMNAQKSHIPKPDRAETHFGYQTVPEAEKQGKVDAVFAKVAERYDLMNDLMSGGLHRAWKNAALDWLNPPRNNADFHLLDIAGGTADIAIRLLERTGRTARATVCDISPEMLRVGRDRVEKKGLSGRIDFACANAESLSFPDKSFDATTIVFGIRNVTHIDRALTEAYRVLKPGGRFICLEFSHVTVPVLEDLYDLYSFQLIPRLGKWVTGDAGAYQYLVESIRRFPDQKKFAAMITAAGFDQVKFRNLSGGIAAIHSAWRI